MKGLENCKVDESHEYKIELLFYINITLYLIAEHFLRMANRYSSGYASGYQMHDMKNMQMGTPPYVHHILMQA
jgi:hypothetical protein